MVRDRDGGIWQKGKQHKDGGGVAKKYFNYFFCAQERKKGGEREFNFLIIILNIYLYI